MMHNCCPKCIQNAGISDFCILQWLNFFFLYNNTMYIVHCTIYIPSKTILIIFLLEALVHFKYTQTQQVSLLNILLTMYSMQKYYGVEDVKDKEDSVLELEDIGLDMELTNGNKVGVKNSESLFLCFLFRKKHVINMVFI